MRSLVEAEQADVLCLQETKLQDKGLTELEGMLGLPGWHYFWNCSVARKGYSGTALFSRSVDFRDLLIGNLKMSLHRMRKV